MEAAEGGGQAIAIYRQIHITFWQDQFILDLTPEEKYFYLYLMTNSKTSQCGIYELPKKVIQLETGYNDETVDKLLNRFIDHHKILYDSSTKEVMILNWLKHNSNTSPKVKNRIAKELLSVKNRDFVNSFYTICKQYGYSMDTETQSVPVPVPVPKPAPNPKEKKDLLSSKVFADDSQEIILAELLKDLILKNNINAKVPRDLQKWAYDIDKMIRLDNRKPKEIKAIIEFSQHHHFWWKNMLSTSALRGQYDRLFNEMKGSRREDTSLEGVRM